MTTIFRAVRVFDGERFLDGPHDVIFDGGAITQVSPTGGTVAAPDATVVDAIGKTLTPGFIDCHIHAPFSGAALLEQVMQPFSYQFFESVRNMATDLALGITTARDAGGGDAGLKQAIAAGLIAGPRLKISVNIMSQTGGHNDSLCLSGVDTNVSHPGKPSGVADGPEECRKKARELFRAGADQIKICTTGGVLSPADSPEHSQFTVAEIRAIVEEAEAHGSYVLAHAQGTAGIKNALNAGVRSIEHGIFLDDEAIQLLLDKDAYLVPTLIAPLWVIRLADSGHHIPQLMVDKAKRVADTHRDAFARAVRAGVKVAMGTDTGVGPHGTNLEELYLMYDGGLTLEGVLKATTATAAELVAPGEKLGRLTPGYLADAVLLDCELTDGAQLKDISSHIAAVYQGGKQVG
ncbi:MAG: amidohydrolase family protein [Propionibacteriaceae bacterium]|jgi:imidazolonepropionase-like amidohydrolase|nr:amidohydrolase family protein [Propionibacteriaceae bacterium]